MFFGENLHFPWIKRSIIASTGAIVNLEEISDMEAILSIAVGDLLYFAEF